ncbi:hypothetical protein BT96DRAFT_596338 [Gymnopus androsaceus JB14]|uniref:F-box domain-containing protein n=1 Tax=Gymnopus androsaceus JB14 TaxID=1447944 RepID=A0A6A4HVH4_9AGAR|nr:hypothetical protein BT96DRAFT_596338 [Gymnopus androsaceus JB14]
MCGSFHLSIDMGFFLVARNHRVPTLVLVLPASRSGTAPMRLHLLNDQIELTPGLCSVLDDLARHADRWKKFKSTIGLPGLNYILKQAHHFTENPFSILDTMDIFYPNKFCADGILGNSFIQCPRLHNLHVSHLRAIDTLELTHLRTLTFTYYHGCSFAVLLEKCPVLETFRVGYINKSLEGWEATPISIPRVRHTHLRTLVLVINKYSVAGAWQSVQLPNLTHLLFGYSDALCDVARERFNELKAMLSNSQCVLECIQLFEDMDPDSDIVASLFQGIRVRSESNSRFVRNHPYNPPDSPPLAGSS